MKTFWCVEAFRIPYYYGDTSVKTKYFTEEDRAHQYSRELNAYELV